MMKTFWRENGTKVLGYVAAFVAGVQGAAAVMTPQPFSGTTMALLAGLNVMLGVATAKRGYTNSKRGPRETHDDGTASESE